jgi:molybdopterin biosynthesis enzyme
MNDIMKDLVKAQRIVMKAARRMPVESIPLEDSIGRIAARSVDSRTVPPPYNWRSPAIDAAVITDLGTKGLGTIEVRIRPRAVVINASGSEVEPLARAVSARLSSWTADHPDVISVADLSEEHIGLYEREETEELIVQIGGEFEPLFNILKDRQYDILFGGVSITPGYETMAAIRDDSLVIRYPGDREATLLCTELFAIQALAAMGLGLEEPPHRIRAELVTKAPVESDENNTRIIPATLRYRHGVPQVRTIDLSADTEADRFGRMSAMIMLPPDSGACDAHSIVNVLRASDDLILYL